MATILEIIQDVSDRIGLPQPSTVVGNADPLVRNMLAMANQEGKELVRRHNWQNLQLEKTWTAVAGETQTSALPDDFDRFIEGTFYNRTLARPVTGPLTPQEWADYKGRLSTWAFESFRLRGNDILILPAPAGGDSMAFEYISTYWVGSTAATGERTAFANDSDEPLLDDELIRLGTTWRYLRSRGLDYSEPFNQYELALAAITGRDGGTRRLSMRERVPFHPRPLDFPDGNWDV